MTWYNYVGLLTMLSIGLVGCGEQVEPAVEVVAEEEPSQLVYVGDTAERVDLMLGEPSIAFPKDGAEVRWYAGYEVTLSNQLVTAVRLKPPESEEEKAERAERARLAEQRLHDAYAAMENREQVSYQVWLKSEEQRLEEAREKRARVQAYEEMVSEEKKTKIISDAIKSCGCRRGHYCRRCR